jgi:sulfonate transport system permease protein
MVTRWMNLPGTLTLLALIAGWEALVRSGAVQFDYLPAPSAILVAAGALLASGQLIGDAVHTVIAALSGWLIACGLGIALGVALGLSRPMRRYSMASVEVLRPLPGIAFAPVAILIFGFSIQTELLIIVYPTVWPVLINTIGGVASVGARLNDVGRTLQLGRMQTVRKIVLPAALPTILVGARLSLGLALVMAIIAEMVGNPAGLGYAVVREQQALQPENMFAYVIFIGLLGIALNASLVALTGAALPGGLTRRRAA